MFSRIASLFSNVGFKKPIPIDEEDEDLKIEPHVEVPEGENEQPDMSIKEPVTPMKLQKALKIVSPKTPGRSTREKQEEMELHAELTDKYKNLVKRTKIYVETDHDLVRRVKRNGWTTCFVKRSMSPSGKAYGYCMFTDGVVTVNAVVYVDYTSVGLYYNLDHPDVLVIGSVSQSEIEEMVNKMGERIVASNFKYEPGVEYTDLIPEKDHVGYAVFFYEHFYDEGENFPLLVAKVSAKRNGVTAPNTPKK